MSVFTRLFGGAARAAQSTTVRTSRVLVCALGSNFNALVQSDGEIYERYYRQTSRSIFSAFDDFSAELAQGFDAVHMFASIDRTGTIVGTSVSGTELIKRCQESGVKLLWIASDNDPSGYIGGFDPQGRPINLVMTIQRKGAGFAAFLDGLLSKMSTGESMPMAWVELAPQNPNDQQQSQLPDTIFSAGYGQLKLR